MLNVKVSDSEEVSQKSIVWSSGIDLENARRFRYLEASVGMSFPRVQSACFGHQWE